MRWAANPDVANSSRPMTTRCASLAHTVRPGKRGGGATMKRVVCLAAVTTIINTHTRYDHSGANPEFPDTVNFVAHENTAAHLASTDCDDGMGFEGGSIKNCERFQGENRKFLPDTTFSTRHTLFSGADQIDLYYFGRGHTDGDTFVVFKDARTAAHLAGPRRIAGFYRRPADRQTPTRDGRPAAAPPRSSAATRSPTATPTSWLPPIHSRGSFHSSSKDGNRGPPTAAARRR